jgi:hypothetical protein
MVLALSPNCPESKEKFAFRAAQTRVWCDRGRVILPRSGGAVCFWWQSERIPPLEHARRPSRIATDEGAGDAWGVVDSHATFPHRLLRLATLQVRIWNLFDRLLGSAINGNQDYEPNHSVPLSVPRAHLRLIRSLAPVAASPAPWRVDKISGGHIVRDANGQALAYVYSRQSPDEARQAKTLTADEGRRIATNIARLPELLGRGESE